MKNSIAHRFLGTPRSRKFTSMARIAGKMTQAVLFVGLNEVAWGQAVFRVFEYVQLIEHTSMRLDTKLLKTSELSLRNSDFRISRKRSGVWKCEILLLTRSRMP
jgi:hypothetical protein